MRVRVYISTSNIILQTSELRGRHDELRGELPFVFRKVKPPREVCVPLYPSFAVSPSLSPFGSTPLETTDVSTTIILSRFSLFHSCAAKWQSFSIQVEYADICRGMRMEREDEEAGSGKRHSGYSVIRDFCSRITIPNGSFGHKYSKRGGEMAAASVMTGQ